MKNVLSISLLAMTLAFTYPIATTAVEAGKDQNPIVGDIDDEAGMTQEEELVVLTVQCVKEGKEDGLKGDELVLFIAECVGLAEPISQEDLLRDEYREPPGGNLIPYDEDESLDDYESLEEPEEIQIICQHKPEAGVSLI